MKLKQTFKNLIKKTGLLNRVVFSKTIKIQDRKIKIPVILGLSCKLTETWMISLLKHIFKQKQGAFLDIGVNLGQTLIKVKGLELNREYIGFEPNPTCVFYTKELIKNNKFENCTILPVGLFTEDNVLSLECINNTEVDSAASLIKNLRHSIIQHRIPVPVFRFQTIANILKLDKIGIVKIDVEGAELEVVKSLYSVFNDYRPIVILEVLPVYSNEKKMRKERQEELEQLFCELNYLFFRVDKSANNTYIGLKKIKEIGIHSDLNQCDYVVIPNELENELEAQFGS